MGALLSIVLSPMSTHARSPSRKNEDLLKSTVQLFGEVVVLPGSSLLLDGKMKSGFAHLGVGLLSKLLLGLPGVVLVVANSYCLAKTNKSLYAVLRDNPPVAKKSAAWRELKAKVNVYLQEGRTVEEIKDGVMEDIEDIFVEATTENASETPA